MVVVGTVHAAGSIDQAASAAVPTWVATSNRDAEILLQAQAESSPEDASAAGLPGYDGKTLISKWIVEAQIGDSSQWVMIYNVR